MIQSKAISGTPSLSAVPALPASEPCARLHVAITSPYVWPWVRRGSERMLHDLSRYLVERGHRVTVFASGPEDITEDRNGVTYHVLKQRFATSLRQFNCCHYFAFRLQRALGRCDPDLVFCMNYFDAYAALRARRRIGAKYNVVFHSAGILSRRYFRAVPLDAWFFRTVRREASLTMAVSHLAAQVYKRDFGHEPLVLPPPVMAAQFASTGEEPASTPSGGPKILFVGDADERRKGARVLCRAFPRVVERFPGAQLLYAGRASEPTRKAVLEELARAGLTDHVTFLGVGRVEDLPGLYRSASVTVLPAVWEAFGMALVESLTAGTPVVATRQGGMVDIVDNEVVGRLFDPGHFDDETDNIAGLAQAIVAVLEQGKSPEVVAACHRRAEQFSWTALGPVYERTLQAIAAGRNVAHPHRSVPFREADAGGVFVSVVIPTHGRRRLLERLLESLSNQTLAPSRYEVHIVHNFTPDGTEEMARAWCGRQPFRACYHRKNHDGPTRSRDFGARVAAGRYVAFIDDDCVATPGWLEAGIAGFGDAAQAGEGVAEIGLVQGRTLPLPMPGHPQRYLVRTIRVDRPTIFFETCNIFYSRRAFFSVGGFSEDFLDRFSGEDTDLGWKFTENGYRAEFAAAALVHHEVFRISYGQWLAEPLLLLKNLPYLAKKYPELRSHLFHRFFFSRDSCLFNVFLVAVLVAPFYPIAGGVLCMPYLVERYRGGGHVGGFVARLARVCFGIPRGLTMWWALAKGSIQARTLLL